MDGYAMQSYFKELSNAYYIAYQQMKRLVKEIDQLEELDVTEEIQIIEKLQSMDITSEITKQYLSVNFSEQKLADIKKELVKQQKDYEARETNLNREYTDWRHRKENLDDMIREVIKTIKENDFRIIVTSKEQIIALIGFFSRELVEHYKVINVEEEFLQSFPTKEKYCQEFFEAYCLEDNDAMEKLHKKYF